MKNLSERELLNCIRNISFNDDETELRLIKEETEKKGAIAITDDPKFGQSVLTNQIEQFRSIVDAGAEFSKPGSEKVSENPLIYLPDTRNLIFSGTIPRLNNLKFQFVLRTSSGEGCFIWADGIILSDKNMETLNKLSNFYINWVNQWNTQSSDLEMLNNME